MRCNTEESFWERVDRSAGPACWPWKGTPDVHGYGSFKIAGRQVRAHRFALELTVGPLGALDALHKCVGNRLCCNPAHLYPGNDKMNADDREAQGRTARGEKNGAHTKPERRAFGLRNARHTNPATTPRGDSHGSRTHPEKFFGPRTAAQLEQLARARQARLDKKAVEG